MNTLSRLPKSIRDFIGRDVVYIVGGSILLTSILYRFNRLPNNDTHLAFYLLGLGIAYVVGYAMQDLFSIVGIVTTSQVTDPCSLHRWAYKRFENKPWEKLPVDKFDNVGSALNKYLDSEIARAHYERTITHLTVGASIGPCMLLSSLMVFWRWYAFREQFDLVASILSLLLSGGLVLLSWIKAMQITRIDAEAVVDYQADEKNKNEV